MNTSTHPRSHDAVSPVVEQLLRIYDRPDACAADLLCDDHDPARLAFTVIDADLNATALTYGQLADGSRRFAHALAEQGVQRGDRVATLAGKSADLIIALLGIWRAGAIHVPLFTAFATPAIELRLGGSGASVVVTDPGQRSKLDSIPGLQIIETGSGFTELLDSQPPLFDSVAVGADGVIVELFTSGTTGTPKAVPVPLRAVASIRSYLLFGLDVRDTDVLWNIADPGWAYGLYYGVIGPLAAGTPNLLVTAPFDAALTVRVIERFGVTNLAAAPTIYRTLLREPTAGALTLRRASSAGEPLTRDILDWSREHWGFEVRDHYGQTELGMVIANGWHDAVDESVVPGSMGRALPGFDATIIDGEVAVDIAASPLFWFTGYVNAPERTAQRFTADRSHYLTGDLASQSPDGRFVFAARSDDIILMAGYRIGPFEVENVLLAQVAVVDAAAIGRPDALLGEALVAYVVLAPGFEPSPELTVDLQQAVKTGFAAHAYPREIFYVDALPKTPSGKLQRHLLREVAP